jgi:hypothetical protein
LGISENVPPYLRRQPPHQRVRYETELDPPTAERNGQNQAVRDEAPKCVLNPMSTDIEKDPSHLCAQRNGVSKCIEAWSEQYQVKRGVQWWAAQTERPTNSVSMPRKPRYFADAAALALPQRYNFFFLPMY